MTLLHTLHNLIILVALMPLIIAYNLLETEEIE